MKKKRIAMKIATTIVMMIKIYDYENGKFPRTAY